MNRLRVVFFGSPAFAVPSLRVVAAGTTLVAVVSQPDRPAGRGQAPSPPAVKVAATALGVPVIQPETLRQDAAVGDDDEQVGPERRQRRLRLRRA